jgi:hypothetical protein
MAREIEAREFIKSALVRDERQYLNKPVVTLSPLVIARLIAYFNVMRRFDHFVLSPSAAHSSAKCRRGLRLAHCDDPKRDNA